ENLRDEHILNVLDYAKCSACDEKGECHYQYFVGNRISGKPTPDRLCSNEGCDRCFHAEPVCQPGEKGDSRKWRCAGTYLDAVNCIKLRRGPRGKTRKRRANGTGWRTGGGRSLLLVPRERRLHLHDWPVSAPEWGRNIEYLVSELKRDPVHRDQRIVVRKKGRASFTDHCLNDFINHCWHGLVFFIGFVEIQLWMAVNYKTGTFVVFFDKEGQSAPFVSGDPHLLNAFCDPCRNIALLQSGDFFLQGFLPIGEERFERPGSEFLKIVFVERANDFSADQCGGILLPEVCYTLDRAGDDQW